MFSDTIRNNILFGSDYDDEWYWTVVKATTLDYDIQTLINLDYTLIGKEGVYLSEA
jgi:ATP-binding cassette subfamily C (CFTR/MRP) protein 4